MCCSSRMTPSTRIGGKNDIEALSVGNSELNTFGVERPVPRAGSTAAEIETVTDSKKLNSVGDPDAEIVVSTPQLALETPAEESLSGVGHCAPLDRNSRIARRDDFVSPKNTEIPGSGFPEISASLAKEIDK